jgi:hypothetical protein
VQAVRPTTAVNIIAEAARAKTETDVAAFDLCIDLKIFPVKLICFLHPGGIRRLA